MTSPTVTLGSVFSVEGAEARWSADASAGLLPAPSESSPKTGGVEWPAALDVVMSKLGDVLDVDLSVVLAMAWSRAEILQKYLDRQRYDPDETISVSLAKHAIHSSHRPSIDVLVNDKKVSGATIDVDVDIQIEGLLLTIEQGSITELRPGSCQVTGSVKCGGVLLAQEESKSVDLPGVVRFEEGIQIARR